ncbi:MAG: carboxyltransferase domain-containing protein, partial [Clostridia bacterium]|nr:carboxyltransferase domain-containing protein [Clostridia bacterium]
MRFKFYEPAENYVLLEFGNRIDEKTNEYILSLADAIDNEAVLDIVPAYSSLLIEYDKNKS